jgi:AraC-like DNA-binding protein
MRYYTFPVPDPLQPYVRCFWALEGDGPYIHRSMADVCGEMVFHYRGSFDQLLSDTAIPSFLVGVQSPSNEVKRFSTSTSFGIFGIYLYPYSLSILTGIAATELNNQMIGLKDLFGQDGSDLADQILESKTHQDRICSASSFLLTRLRDQPSNDGTFAAMTYLLQANGQNKIEDVAARFCVSRRQFERKFKAYSGFSPKQFARIARFKMATQSSAKTQSLTQVALECGYFDQSHFIHDFKKFSGYNPSTYFFGSPEGIKTVDPGLR